MRETSAILILNWVIQQKASTILQNIVITMQNLPSDIILHISEFLKEEEHEQLSKTCIIFYWTLWDISTCYWCDREPQLSDYDIVQKDDFIPVCWFPHPNKCMGGCFGLPWHRMCVRCQEYEEQYYDELQEEYAELSFFWNDTWD